jgi:UrcA family protein
MPLVGLIDVPADPVEPGVIERSKSAIPTLRDAEGLGLPGPGASYPASDPLREDSPMANLNFILLAAPMALTGLAVPAAAAVDEEGERRTTIVRYDDLNLATEDGRESLTTRVKYAEQKVCGSRPHYRQPLHERAIAIRCEKSALADAEIKLAELFNGNGARYAEAGRLVIAAAP